MSPEPGSVVVVDSVTSSSSSCDVSSLVAATTYWCQGKPGGCSLEAASLSSLTSCPDLAQVRLGWHWEPDYGSTEIPCPAYNSGPLSKKFSKLTILTSSLSPLEISLSQFPWRTPATSRLF